MSISRDENGEYVGIKCDACGTMAPPAPVIAAGHGLINMGWHCSGGTHYCPNHDKYGKELHNGRTD